MQEEGFPTLEEERKRNGKGAAKRRSAQAQRGRLGCLLHRAKDGVPQEGLVTESARDAQTVLCICSFSGPNTKFVLDGLRE